MMLTKSIDSIELVRGFITSMLENYDLEIRQCDVCKAYMIEGCCVENGEAYYCSQECMYQEMTQEEFDELYDNGEGSTYWTDWEEHSYEYNAIKEILNKFPEITDIKLK